MPLITLDPKNRATTAAFPRLKLERDERKRIICLEDPTVEFVHTLRAPALKDGEVLIESIKNAKTGEMEDRTKYDFIGRPLCLGSFDRLTKDGADPDHCPACKGAKETDAVAAAERRYAMNIGVYVTRPGSFDVVEPFQMTIVVWSFADQIFNKLVDVKEEWGDLKRHDLNLGPCLQVQFQRFEINVAARAEWLASDARKKATAAVFKESRCQDLVAAIGRPAERAFMATDVNTCIKRHKIAFGGPSSPAAPPLSDDPPPPPPPDPDEISAEDFNIDDLLNEPPANGQEPDTALETPATPREEDTTAEAALADVRSTPEPDPTPAAPAKEAIDFDDLLNAL